MARRRPEDRIEQLIAAATRVFIGSGGFQRAQIQDVAKELGVAKGTVYLYVESKEALFDLCVRSAAGVEVDPRLPIATPGDGATVGFLREFIASEARFPSLEAGIAQGPGGGSLEVELIEIVEELYRVLHDYRDLIRLIGASAHELPELAELWYRGTRGGMVGRLTDYLEAKIEAGQIRALPDARVGARLITQVIYWFAVQRFYDPWPEEMSEEAVRQSVRDAALRFCAVECGEA